MKKREKAVVGFCVGSRQIKVSLTTEGQLIERKSDFTHVASINRQF